MIAKIHKGDGRKIIAICDDNLIDKKFEENGLQLDLTSNFYKGERIGNEELKKEISNAYILNVVGKDSVDFCLECELISKKNIIKIRSIPHAQVIISEN